jgi:hypothetical protein
MEIVLKNIKFSEALSEETNAFVADVFVDNQKVAYAKNDGHGGSTFYLPYEGKRELLKKAEDFCLTLPAEKIFDFEIEMNLELKIDLLLTDWLKAKNEKNFQKQLQKDSNKGICVKTKSGYDIISWKGFTIEKLLQLPNGREALKKHLIQLKEEGKEILNKNIPVEFFSK